MKVTFRDGETPTEKDVETMRAVIDELSRNGITIVDVQVGKSIVFWLRCKTADVSTMLLRFMDDGRLRDLIATLIHCLCKESLEVVVSVIEDDRKLIETFLISPGKYTV